MREGDNGFAYERVEFSAPRRRLGSGPQHSCCHESTHTRTTQTFFEVGRDTSVAFGAAPGSKQDEFGPEEVAENNCWTRNAAPEKQQVAGTGFECVSRGSPMDTKAFAIFRLRQTL